jgi:hypothetical protein
VASLFLWWMVSADDYNNPQLCVKLQKAVNPPTLGIPAMDRLLGLALGPQHSSAGGPVVEITSTSTAAGKSHILYYIAALSTLPSAHRGLALHGKGATIVVFDLDGRFDVHRLRRVMNGHILSCFSTTTSSTPPPSTEDLESLTSTALEHIHILRPNSSRELISQLKLLPDHLLDPHSHHHSAHRSLDALLLDGISAFHWQDRLDSAGYQNLWELLVHQLKTVATRFGAFVVATNWGLQLSDTTERGRVAFRSHLPPAWGKFVDVKFVVERCGEGAFRGWVDTRALGVRVREGLREVDCGFRYGIGREGITFGE